MADLFSQILEWRRAEASGRALAKISPEFYGATARYLADLRRSYESELRENPSGRKGEISRQTYQRASQVARDIVEARAQKLLTAAFQASVGGPRDIPNAVGEERALFEQLLGALLDFRRTAAPYLEPTGPAGPAPVAEPAPLHPATSAAAAVTPTHPAPAALPAVAPTAYVRVVLTTRPLQVGSETIDLREDDILSLPPEAAKRLVDAKVAEPLTTVPPSRAR